MSLKRAYEPFAERVAQSQSNPDRLAAINRGAVRFYEHRDEVMDSLPDADATRDLARAIRAHTISRLDEYLEQFEASMTANGGQVHWARDAAEAQRIALTIAEQTGSKRIVKSKSMLTEEIGLNDALEESGLRAVETDLGEYIVQLAKDRPSHIIAPILHLTRQEVSAALSDELQEDLGDEIGDLTIAARQALRHEFLQADMGISGCNFAVAETGTICLVTNEGNGRMITSLPRVHVALMGIERIVPGMADLAIMLQVLARSATGQKLTSYTSLINGPRREGEAHGPEEVHVVIVDNGRSQALGGDLAEILYCIRCGACLNSCPVYRSIGGHAYGSVYQGPMGSVVSPILGGIPAFPELPHASTLCGACEEVCPVRIDLPGLLVRLRRNTVKTGYSPGWVSGGIKAYTAAARSPARFRLAGKLASLGSRALGDRWFTGQLPGPLSGWTRFRHFPLFARTTFQAWWRKRRND